MRVRDSLLPGTSPEVLPPSVVFTSAPVIRRARRMALARDILDILLLLAVDYFFVSWPYARLPLMNRYDSLELLVVVNAIFAGYLWIARAFPRWRARRVAGSWSPREQERLMVSLQSRASR
jgi:hypothetical protein